MFMYLCVRYPLALGYDQTISTHHKTIKNFWHHSTLAWSALASQTIPAARNKLLAFIEPLLTQ